VAFLDVDAGVSGDFIFLNNLLGPLAAGDFCRLN